MNHDSEERSYDLPEMKKEKSVQKTMTPKEIMPRPEWVKLRCIEICKDLAETMEHGANISATLVDELSDHTEWLARYA